MVVVVVAGAVVAVVLWRGGIWFSMAAFAAILAARRSWNEDIVNFGESVLLRVPVSSINKENCECSRSSQAFTDRLLGIYLQVIEVALNTGFEPRRKERKRERRQPVPGLNTAH